MALLVCYVSLFALNLTFFFMSSYLGSQMFFLFMKWKNIGRSGLRICWSLLSSQLVVIREEDIQQLAACVLKHLSRPWKWWQEQVPLVGLAVCPMAPWGLHMQETWLVVPLVHALHLQTLCTTAATEANALECCPGSLSAPIFPQLQRDNSFSPWDLDAFLAWRFWGAAWAQAVSEQSSIALGHLVDYQPCLIDVYA